VIERALLHARGSSVLGLADLRFGDRADAATGGDESSDLDLTLEQLERKHVERVLKAENNSVEAAAARLGISRSALYQRLKRYRDQLGASDLSS
jgi:transcriptional regulator with PAS, ATPase and Fis domain